jgi:hypothetical protein
MAHYILLDLTTTTALERKVQNMKLFHNAIPHILQFIQLLGSNNFLRPLFKNTILFFPLSKRCLAIVHNRQNNHST